MKSTQHVGVRLLSLPSPFPSPVLASLTSGRCGAGLPAADFPSPGTPARAAYAVAGLPMGGAWRRERIPC